MDKRTKEAYLGKARHNLKNPINAILGYSEMLIEDCEDEGIEHPIDDLNRLNKAGLEILSIIEKNFDERALEDPHSTLVTLAKETEVSIREPLNTIIGYSELLLEDNESIGIDNFNSDINRISESGRLLEKELGNIINFNGDELNPKKDDNSDDSQYSMVQDVMESIHPIDVEKDRPQILGKLLVVDDNKLLRKRRRMTMRQNTSDKTSRNFFLSLSYFFFTTSVMYLEGISALFVPTFVSSLSQVLFKIESFDFLLI